MNSQGTYEWSLVFSLYNLIQFSHDLIHTTGIIFTSWYYNGRGVSRPRARQDLQSNELLGAKREESNSFGVNYECEAGEWESNNNQHA